MQVPSLLTGCVWRVLSHGEAARLAGSIGTPRKSISVASQRGKLRVSRVRHSHSQTSAKKQPNNQKKKKPTTNFFCLEALDEKEYYCIIITYFGFVPLISMTQYLNYHPERFPPAIFGCLSLKFRL